MFFLLLSSEVGNEQPVRESDLESLIVSTLASFDLMQISCSQKVTQMKKRCVGGANLGITNQKSLVISRLLTKNQRSIIETNIIKN